MGADRLQDRFREAMSDVSKLFGRPRAVLDDRGFDREQKRKLLKQWEYDLRGMQVASDENMVGEGTGEAAELLREVRACLGTLGDSHAPERSASHKQGG
jgi:hypothetical protein